MIRCEETFSGTRWYKGDVLHRDNDLPAVELKNGLKEWYIDGKRHRLGGPASLALDGAMWWWEDGKPHRIDGPAIINAVGIRSQWMVRGKIHRVEGPALIENIGVEHWYFNGYRHRSDGRAIQYNHLVSDYATEWFLHGVGVDEDDVVKYAKKEIYETAIALSSVELPPYCLLWILEYVNAMIAVKRHHATIQLLQGLWNSRNEIIRKRQTAPLRSHLKK